MPLCAACCILARDDGPELLEDAVGAVKSLRWRLATQPQPLEYNPALAERVEHVRKQVWRLRGAIQDEALLDELLGAAEAVGSADRPIGDVLARSIEEVGAQSVSSLRRARVLRLDFQSWLDARGVLVLTAGELEREQPNVDQAYVVGPPRFFRSSLVTAPVTGGVSFIMPAWFGDRIDPPLRDRRLCGRSDSGRQPRSSPRVMTVSRPRMRRPLRLRMSSCRSRSGGASRSPDRDPHADEVEARKVLLSGNLAIWLDDGDRIRALDPEQPPGERVVYTEVGAVRAGTFLLLRQGESERGVLYRAALGRLSSKGPTVEAAQRAWKESLTIRLQELTYRRTVKELRASGVRSADRAKAWTEPTLVRPNRDEDFEGLLRWLGIPIQPTFGFATMLRRAHHQASADLREELEHAVSEGDLSVLGTRWSLGA